MDIGIVHPELIYPRGAEKQVCELSYHLNKMGHEVTIYTFEKEENYIFDSLLKNVNIISLDTKWVINCIFGFNQFRWVHLIKKISSKIGDHDIVNAHNHPAQWISKFTDIPTVWTCNEPYRYGSSALNKLNFYSMDKSLTSNVNLTLAFNSRMQEMIQEIYPENKVAINVSGVNLYRPIKHSDDGYFNSIFVGPLHPRKRQLDIIKAFSLIESEIPNIRMHFVGGNVGISSKTLKKSMIDLADKNGLEILFYDSISDEELYNLYDIADISVFVPESEPWGIFPLETILGGIPTIISDQCGVKDILPDDHFVVETGNIKQLVDKIVEIKDNYDEYKDKTLKTSETISENYSWEAYSKRMENIFNKIIE
ncbi:MAG: glycosyltransferase family 4 protein [Methanobacterium paludis]|uniref:Glycosyl transferase group 1 n=1 Tax=Methanobacterium paludis (strain DSM 25820 / JCM 18151 / SWAN1) TaxID=868131 RepID=F6D678_METPW|nr:glycosyltransferase family 4 protein [Methanobacterium paludis]AEG18291.1 glycosyl transferase group 1 [Methanobacterium paludis]MCE7698131.1 glycosyltransferase family 4 protein [Methanobacterium paludis]